MNKTNMIRKTAKRTGLSIATVAKVVDALFQPSHDIDSSGKITSKAGVIATELAAGRRVMLPGFGNFCLKITGWRDVTW